MWAFPGLSFEVSITVSSRAAMIPILRRQRFRGAERCTNHSANKPLLRHRPRLLPLTVWHLQEESFRPSRSNFSILRETSENLRRHRSQTTVPELRFLELLRSLCHLRPKPLSVRVPLPPAAAWPWFSPPTPQAAPADSPPEQQAPQLESWEQPTPQSRRRHVRVLAPRPRLRLFPAPPLPGSANLSQGPAEDRRCLSLLDRVAQGELQLLVPCNVEETTLQSFVAWRLKDESVLPGVCLGMCFPYPKCIIEPLSLLPWNFSDSCWAQPRPRCPCVLILSTFTQALEILYVANFVFPDLLTRSC